MKHKIKLKQTQALCWQSKHEPVPGISCVYEWSDSGHVFQISLLPYQVPQTQQHLGGTGVCEMSVCIQGKACPWI